MGVNITSPVRLCVMWWPDWPVTADPAADGRAFESVVRAVTDLVPLVEVAQPGRLTFATRGPSRYLGGDEAMAQRLSQVTAPVTAPVASPVAIGVADGRLAAEVAVRQAARRGDPVIVAPGDSPDFLAPVPVRALAEFGGVPTDVVDRLDRLGLRRLADIAAMSPADLLARFGHPGRQAQELARGLDVVPLVPGPPNDCREVVRHLDDPLPHLDAVVFVVRQLAEELTADLGRRGQVCTRLLVEAETEHGEHSRRCWSHAEGLSMAMMIERARWQMEGWGQNGPTDSATGGPTGGIVLVRLTPEAIRADQGRQQGIWGGQSQADEWALRAMARVAALLGHDAVTVPEWRGGRDPWQRYRLVPSADVDPAERAQRVQPTPRPWPGQLPAPAPARVYGQPLAAELFDESGQPVLVSGRGEINASPVRVVVGGNDRAVTAWAGPWPVEERWWDPRRHRRQARLQVVTADGDATLLVVERGRWWVQAVYA